MSPIDPDTISFPVGGTQTLCLSVSEDPIEPVTLQTPYDVYTENFLLSTDLSTDQVQPSRFGLFTKNLIVRASETSPKSLGVPGRAGKDTENPNGCAGGTLEVYVQNLDMGTVKRLRLDARGGKGQSFGEESGSGGANGGNGGDGGHIKVLSCAKPTLAQQYAEGILDKMRVAKNVWPKDFEADIEQLVLEVSKKYVTDIHKIPEFMKTTKAMLEAAAPDVKRGLIHLLEALGRIRQDMEAAILGACSVGGGEYGTGHKGTKAAGTSGKPGADGHAITIETTPPDVGKSDVCFVHPAQCRMLLDKANVLWWCGSDLQRAKAANIVEDLRQRLAFLPAVGLDTALAKAYRSAENRLGIVSGSSTGNEPISITQLRTIKREADTATFHILAGDDIYGWGARHVPRLAYSYYQTNAKKFLSHLAELDAYYHTIWDKTKAEADWKDALRHRAVKYGESVSLTKSLLEIAEVDLTKGVEAIKIANDAIPPAKLHLKYAVDRVIDKIEHAISFPWDQLISALSQVLFIHGGAIVAMEAVQGAGLLKTMVDKLETDTGLQVNRSYVLKHFHKITGTIKSLDEGYQILRDGKVNLDDPGAEKLILEEKEFNKLLDEFDKYIDTSTLGEVHKRFKAYVDIVQQRNQAVLRYNTDLALILKYRAELEGLQTEKQDMARTEWNDLKPGHPAMLTFVKRLYQDSIRHTQMWLFKQQRAYSFLALDNTNLIGEAMKDFNFSSFDSATLKNVQVEINRRHGDFLESASQPPQTFHGLPYKLDDDHLSLIRGGGKDGVHLSVRIPTSGPPGKSDPFEGKADIRLLKARFFAEGAITKSSRLDVFLTHCGDEVILNKSMKQFKFSHDPLVVEFKYNLQTGDYTGTDTTDGVIGSVDGSSDKYALVGPYTTWKIKIEPESNEGLNLSKVTAARLEFDFQFRAVQPVI